MNKKFTGTMLAMIMFASRNSAYAAQKKITSYEDLLPNHDNLIETLKTVIEKREQMPFRDMLFVNIASDNIGLRYVEACSLETIKEVCYYDTSGVFIDKKYVYAIWKNEFEEDLYLVDDSSYVGTKIMINENNYYVKSAVPDITIEDVFPISHIFEEKIEFVNNLEDDKIRIYTYEDLCNALLKEEKLQYFSSNTLVYKNSYSK